MQDDQFWQLVKAGIPPEPFSRSEHFEKMEAVLKNLSKTDLKEFIMLFNSKIGEAYRWDLWAVAWITRDRFGNFGCGDDAFYAFCAALICHGPEIFNIAITNPDELANFPRIENCKNFDDFAYLAVNTYKALYGDMDFNPYVYTPGKPLGREWAEDDVEYLCSSFPKSVERWGMPTV